MVTDRAARKIQKISEHMNHLSKIRPCNRRLPLVFLFSGHGAQSFGMAKEIYDDHPKFRNTMNLLDRAFYRKLGVSVLDYMYRHRPESNKEDFSNILYTHPAIFMVEYSLSSSLMEEVGPPDYVFGASLGELTAATIAEALPLQGAIDIISEQAHMLNEQQTEGGMLAILGDTTLYHQFPHVFGGCEIAARVSPNQFVIAGEAALLPKVEAFLNSIGFETIRMPVRHGFHSSSIDELQSKHEEVAKNKSYTKPNIPLMSGTTANFVRQYSAYHVWQVLRRPLQIRRAVSALKSLGGAHFVDLGPGSTLASLVAESRRDRHVSRILTPFGNESRNFKAVLSSLMACTA